MYSYKIEQAIKAASLLHRDQIRKGKAKLPYISHLMAVAMILTDYTNDENTIVAGLLHDTIEDTDYTKDELREDFGDIVSKIVIAVSEPKTDTKNEHKLTWQERKKVYAKQLKQAPNQALLVSAADKIHNMRSIIEEYYEYTDSFVKDFGGSLDERVMMYQDISNILNNRLDNDIVGEFNHVYTEYKNFILNVKKQTI